MENIGITTPFATEQRRPMAKITESQTLANRNSLVYGTGGTSGLSFSVSDDIPGA